MKSTRTKTAPKRKTVPFEINRELTLSTGHIPATDDRLLAEAAKLSGVQRIRFWWLTVPDYGYRIYVDSADDIRSCGCSAALCNLVKLARKHECKWLVLDPDGQLRDDLTVFEW